MTKNLKTIFLRSLSPALPILFALTLMLAWTVPVNAQRQNQRADTTQGMMQGMMMQQHMQMMQQMMNDPMQRPAMLVHMLPTMQKPLALSDDQLARMKQHAQKFNEQMQALVNTTASQMESVLSAEQRTMLSEMEPMQLHQHMMTNMTMMEMMQTMHGNMMHGNMMQDGMMQDGMMKKQKR